ncbi:sulfur carrier protein ThiS [Evansella sp. AB-P1]|uniref:sulfur carrier protein ThiS n=1 Tax=Evansella sp. AB-P1 TaxID=3037653 RepID=UPI00241D7EAE|nr:sulfur carrier protein ThiS [Evansella sp. AB-P1]MDG5786055.1 sulfur carrier protein ThiS [Evansella sp. AB-P1]
MIVQVNGKRSELPDSIKSIAELLAHYELDKKVVIVEMNETIVDRNEHDNTIIQEGDKIELVQFVGGG